MLLNMPGAEILGVAAAVEQFVEAAFKIAKYIKAVVDQIQDAPEQIGREAATKENNASRISCVIVS